MTEPTAGEWGASGTMVVTPPPEESQRRIRDKEFPFTSKRICLADPSPYVPQAEAEANARLIAAVKELRAVSEALDAYQRYYAAHLQWPEGMPGNQFYSDKLMLIVRQARAALAKATGQPTPEPTR